MSLFDRRFKGVKMVKEQARNGKGREKVANVAGRDFISLDSR